ncbi:hypothetical protein [Nocardia wallacei]|uniref:hypothetical protein n=1 Tax=Nocardia wallacei TaxID=480035 RepID=UPI0016572D61|nr:hypothetical protein [Nocardia wallacei]
MRIIRNDDHDDNNDRNQRRQQSQDPKVLGDILADEISAYLVAASDAADRHAAQLPPPVEPAVPAPIRPVPHRDNPDADAGDGDGGQVAEVVVGLPEYRRSLVPVVRGTAAGSAVVVAVAVTAGWGQPAPVLIPVAGYGVGWLAYLWWNAALRPPLPHVLAAAVTGVGHLSAAFARVLAGAVQWLARRAAATRTRHENTRAAAAVEDGEC